MIDWADRQFSALIAWLGAARGRAMLAAGILAAVLAAPGFFSLPPSDRDESRFAQASKQMLQSGDLVDIRFQNEPRHKKPAGIYWLQAGAASLFGGEQAPIWAYRLPSMLGVVLASALLVWALWPLTGGFAAALAGLMLASMLLVQVEARIAKTDAALLAASVAALGALARVWLGQAQGWAAPFVFWTALAVGILLKGPILLGPILGAVAWVAIARRNAAWLLDLRPLPGIAWCVLLAAPWFIAIALRSEGGFFAASVGEDLGAKIASAQEAHGAPPGTYAVAALGTFWPWSFMLLLALPWIWRWRREPALRLLLGWTIPFWLALEIVPTKLPHYVLPLYPALAALTAAAMVNSFDRDGPPEGWRFWLPAALFVAPALGLPIAHVVFVDAFAEIAAVPIFAPLLIGAAAAAAAIGAAMAARRWRLGAATGFSLASAGLIYLGAFQFALPSLSPVWLSPRLAVESERLCPGAQVGLIGYAEPSAVFLLGTKTALLNADPDAWLTAAAPRLLWVANERGQEPAPAPELTEAVARFSGFNYNGGDWLEFAAYPGRGC